MEQVISLRKIIVEATDMLLFLNREQVFTDFKFCPYL